MKYITATCSQCGKSTEKQVKYYNYAIKRGHKLFCSIICNNENKLRSRICNCAQCDKSITKPFSALAKSQSGNTFCDRTCATIFNNTFYKSGKNHANFKHGRSGYRNKVEIAKCNRCGYNKYIEILQVHHRDRDRSNNKVENLEVLCPNCHQVEHHILKSHEQNKK
ncbi:hypothetical protein [Acinetobacter sp.]|uniref:hypothetical protein n=1 Tax=Acinetobacter sp. TaxID=472 RepID=UPI0037500778